MTEDMVQIVDRQHFAHASVMVVNRLPRVLCWIEVAQPGFCTPHKCSVAEDYPGLFGSGYESLPEDSKCRRRTFSRASHARASAYAVDQSSNRDKGNGKQNGEDQYRPWNLSRGDLDFGLFRFMVVMRNRFGGY